MKKAIALKGNNFILRPYKKGDEFSIAENADNKTLAKNMYDGFPSPYTIKDAKKWVNKNLKKINIKRKGLHLAIEVDNKARRHVARENTGVS